MAVTQDAVLSALRAVQDPELLQDVVSLGMVKALTIDGSRVSFLLELTTPACPLKAQIEAAATEAVKRVPGVTEVAIRMGANVRRGGSAVATGQVPGAAPLIPQVKNTIAVASGKGGVGKTTVAVNLAVALAKTGAQVGLMDGDIYGPNVPLMMGITDLPTAEGDRIVPPQNHGVKVISMTFFTKGDDAVIWRGPMLHKAILQFLGQVAWGELDYLVIDLPPGTGDVQLSLSQAIPLTGAVIVTTPQEVSLMDVRKAIKMFQKVEVPLLGLVENMSGYTCTSCGHQEPIFGQDGGRRLAETLALPFLGAVPIGPSMARCGDTGRPCVIAEPQSPQAQALSSIAGWLAAQISLQHFRKPPQTVGARV
ncbi:MAG: Mrp/NBP35 family ATP-binding protein [Candidatus Omnitrophica bacterium]|nr:Mrp/NBP35 family ATP-binding protein [Candidatus Omnitrophota bacterium]